MPRSPALAVVTCDQFPQLFREESELVPLLQARGVRASVVRWSDPGVDWRSFDLVLLRSTWDYFERIEEFRAWLDGLEATGVRVVNPTALVRWNLDKTYLRELEQKGARIVPTVFAARSARVDLRQVLEERGWARAIIKPAISGGAYRTHRVEEGQAGERQADLDVILAGSGALIQPFVPEIQVEGEWSLFFFSGTFSHALLKTPAQGDFRVQTQFGGRFERVEPAAQMSAEALKVMELLPYPALYARIDGVRLGARFCLMEVEVIEPYLFTADAPAALERFADAVAAAAANT